MNLLRKGFFSVNVVEGGGGGGRTVYIFIYAFALFALVLLY